MSVSNEYSIPRTKPLSQYLNTQVMMDRERKRQAVREQYIRFVDKIEANVFKEALNYLVQKTLPETIGDEGRQIAKGLCTKYVEESSIPTMLRRFKTTSLPLAEMAIIIENTTEKIKNNVDPSNELTFTINQKDKKDFFDSLANVGFDKIVDKVRARVAKATEEFVQNNIKDKTEMEKMALATKERIEAAKTKNDEERKQVTKEFTSMYNGHVNRMVSKRKRNVYEQMINSMANTVMKNDQLRPGFVNESNGLDVEKVGSVVNVMYTFLETVNTAKIEKMTEKRIKDFIKSIA